MRIRHPSQPRVDAQHAARPEGAAIDHEVGVEPQAGIYRVAVREPRRRGEEHEAVKAGEVALDFLSEPPCECRIPIACACEREDRHARTARRRPSFSGGPRRDGEADYGRSHGNRAPRPPPLSGGKRRGHRADVAVPPRRHRIDGSIDDPSQRGRHV